MQGYDGWGRIMAISNPPPPSVRQGAAAFHVFQSSHICFSFTMIQLANPASGTRRAVSGFRVNNGIISDFNGISDGLEPFRNLQLRFQPSHSLTHNREVWFQDTDTVIPRLTSDPANEFFG